MKNVICKIQENDQFTINNPDFVVDLSSKDQYHYTFWDRNKLKLYKCGEFSDTAIDLLYISLMVYYADRKIVRKKENDAWTRNIKVYMPVLEIDIWNKNKKLLERMLSFLSGDIWHFNFRKRILNSKEEKAKKGMQRQKNVRKPKAICMLSGGLDSFIGAIDLLEKEKNVWFVGHYGGGKGVLQYQKAVMEQLKQEYSLSDDLFFNFHASPVKDDKREIMEDTTRTRSLMFFAHAIILASNMKNETTLYIPENGLISLNIPLTNTRLGSNSTRTTHPYYMALLQELIYNIGLKVKLYNPYQFKTKGQMIAECKNTKFLKNTISKTMSCSHPDIGRYLGESDPIHCGNCLPCIIRRAAIKYAYKSDTSVYRDKDFKERQALLNLRSFKLGIKDYLESNVDLALTVLISGSLEGNIDKFCTVYKNGMNELKVLLNKYNG